MNPAKVNREKLNSFTDLPNVGKAMALDFQRMGFKHPHELTGQDPRILYKKLCVLTGSQQDPCVLDVFTSVTRFLNGEAPQPWWHFSQERKNSNQ